MRWILALITLLMVLFSAIVIVGGLLPTIHEASREQVLAVAPDEAFAVIAAIEDSDLWRPEVYDVRRLDDVGRRFREVGVHGPVTVAIVEREPPERLVLAVEGAGPGFEGTWTFALVPSEAGTRLTLTERGTIENPVFRFLSRFIVGYTTSIDAYLAALAERIESGPGIDRWQPPGADS